jgi:hypothetical protein
MGKLVYLGNRPEDESENGSDVNFVGIPLDELKGVPPIGKIVAVEEPNGSCIDLCIRVGSGVPTFIELYLRDAAKENYFILTGLNVFDKKVYLFAQEIEQLKKRVNLFQFKPTEYKNLGEITRYRYDFSDREKVYKSVSELGGRDISSSR